MVRELFEIFAAALLAAAGAVAIFEVMLKLEDKRPAPRPETQNPTVPQ